jgi:hypothetical protein
VDGAGHRFELREHLAVTADRKGWVVIRFPPVRVESVHLSILRDAPRRFSVFEARLLTVAPATGGAKLQ